MTGDASPISESEALFDPSVVYPTPAKIGKLPAYEAPFWPPRVAHEVNAEFAEVIPVPHVADVVWEKNFNRLSQFSTFGESPRNQSRPGRIEYKKLISHQGRRSAHHGLNPIRISKPFYTILDNGLQELMLRSRAKAIISNVPVHFEFVAHETTDCEPLEREDTPRFKQSRNIRRQQNIQVKIEPSVSIDRKVAKKIVTLDPEGKRTEDRPVLWELGLYELFDLLIIKE